MKIEKKIIESEYLKEKIRQTKIDLMESYLRENSIFGDEEKAKIYDKFLRLNEWEMNLLALYLTTPTKKELANIFSVSVVTLTKVVDEILAKLK